MSDATRKETAASYQIVEYRSPFSVLAEEIYRDRVICARRATAEEKILAGQRLFESACEITLAGIRDQNPVLTEEECRKILRDRLAWRRRQERAGEEK